METPTLGGPVGRAAYGKDEAFDLEAGMAVYAPDGQRLGIVTEVAGFGATRQGAAPSQGADLRVTEAQSGTGYFKVHREAAPGAGTTDLTVPFHGIQGVTQEGGVIVNAAIVSELRRQADQCVSQPARAATRQSWWQRWLPGKQA